MCYNYIVVKIIFGSSIILDFGDTTLFLFQERMAIVNIKEIDYETDFGNVKIKLNVLMDKKHISISTMSKLANVKYEIVKKYYYGDNYAFTSEILAKFCYILTSPCELQLLPDVIAVDAGFLGGLRKDLAVHRHLDEAVVHRDGALVGAREHEALHLWRLALADQVLDRLGDDHDLCCHDAAMAVRAHEELLAEDGLQGRRELQADLSLPCLREHAHDTVDGVHGAVCVQCRENEVSGLGSGQRRLDRGEVTHLADQDDIRVLTQDGAQALRVGLRISADLALIDDALVRRVDVLDRVLQRDDVLVPRVIDLVEDRRQRRRLTGAGFTGDQYDPLLQ